MWEETGAPPQAAIPRKKNRKKRKSEENLVLWAQILLCLAAVGAYTVRTIHGMAHFAPAAGRIRDGNAARAGTLSGAGA